MRQAISCIRCTLAAASFACASLAHAGAAPDPGDYTALPAGTALSVLYLREIRGDEAYVLGRRQALPRDLDLNLTLGLLRQVWFTNLGGYTIDPQVIVPFARQSDALSGRKPSGVGDVVFGATLWNIADLTGGEHLGYSVFVTAPTGARRDEAFAISDNRWSADLQVGYIRRVAPHWSVDLIGSAEVFQDRRDTGAAKDPVSRLYAHLRYHLNDACHVAASLRYTEGGREKLGATLAGGRKDDINSTLTWAGFLTKQVQLQAQYSRDLRVENGPRLNTLAFRALYVY